MRDGPYDRTEYVIVIITQPSRHYRFSEDSSRNALKMAIIRQRIEHALTVGPIIPGGVSLGNSILKKQEVRQGEAVATTA